MSNLVPEGWSYNALSSLADIDKDSLKGSTAPDYRFRYIDIASVSTGKIRLPSESIAFNVAPSRARKRLQSGDVLMSTVRPNLKAFAYFGFEGDDFVASTGFSVIRATNGHDARFIFNSILADDITRQIEALVVGSNYPAINSSDVKNLEVLTPTKPEQQKIAAILTSVDEVIEKTQAQIDKLKDLKTAMMQELLTNGVGTKQGAVANSNSAAGRKSYIPHTEFKDSAVGRIPKSWEVVKISELCTHVVDCVNKTAPVVDVKTPYKMIRTTNVRHGRIDTDNVRRVSKETYDTWTRRLKPENGDLIFTREAPVGECGVLEDSRGVFLGQRTMMYRANEGKTSSRFLMYSLMSEYGKQQLEDFSGGSTVPHMRVPDCGKILIKTPPLNEQNKIVNSLSCVDISIRAKEKKLAKVQNTKKALMQDLLTGKVRVKLD
ncbi:restriction endonuclease subunit S [Shewanella sp. 0m-8]